MTLHLQVATFLCLFLQCLYFFERAVLFSRGKIKYYTHPPETLTLPAHLSTESVWEWGAAFNTVRVHDTLGCKQGYEKKCAWHTFVCVPNLLL